MDMIDTAKIHNQVFGSATEAEIGATYAKSREDIPILNMMIYLGHHQPPIPIQVDKTMAVGFANGTIKQKIEINRHALLLGPGLNWAPEVIRLLEPWMQKYWRLPHKTFLSGPP